MSSLPRGHKWVDVAYTEINRGGFTFRLNEGCGPFAYRGPCEWWKLPQLQSVLGEK